MSDDVIDSMKGELVNYKMSVEALQRQVDKKDAVITDLLAWQERAKVVLKLIATGIWRDKEMNACGLSGAAVAVHELESILADEAGNHNG